jgi:carbonic anhydrase
VEATALTAAGPSAIFIGGARKKPMPDDHSAAAAFRRLREGNRRFATNVRSIDALLSQVRRADLSARQRPFAIVLGCSDARAPAEIVFDQGLGDLFVIRVAGNVVAPSQIGSVEFAADLFETQLVVVMGHSDCGAVRATIEAIRGTGASHSPGKRAIVDRIRPGIEELVREGSGGELIEAAVRANVRAAAMVLRHGSPLIEELEAAGRLAVVGAVYRLDTGEVDFFDGVAALATEGGSPDPAREQSGTPAQR